MRESRHLRRRYHVHQRNIRYLRHGGDRAYFQQGFLFLPRAVAMDSMQGISQRGSNNAHNFLLLSVHLIHIQFPLPIMVKTASQILTNGYASRLGEYLSLTPSFDNRLMLLVLEYRRILASHWVSKTDSRRKYQGCSNPANSTVYA